MENPLKRSFKKTLDSQEPGRESRKIAREKRKNDIIEKALSIFQGYLPWMTEANPSSRRFCERWPLIDMKLREQLSIEQHYRLAYNHLCKLLEQGKRAKLWNIELPEPFISLPQSRVTRPESWQKHSLVASSIYKKGIFEINPRTLSTSEAFAQLLLSMIFHGGLNRTELWVALGKCLQQDKPLEGNSDFLFLRLMIDENKKIPTNARYRDEASSAYINKIEHIHVPDPLSLGLLSQFLRRKNADWKAPCTVAECLMLINGLTALDIKSKALRFGGIAFAEHIDGISLPQVFVQIALGKMNSSSLPKPYWNRFFQPQTRETLDTTFQFFAYAKVSPIQFEKRNASIGELPFLYESLRDIFGWSHNEKKPPQELVRELVKISELDLSLAQSWLLKWFIHLLQDRKNAPTTLKRYFHCLALRWLIETQDLGFGEFDTTDFFEFYQDMLDQITSPKERHYCACRLDDLHKFGVSTLGLPPLPESLSNGNENQPHVCAGFIDEPLFQKLLEQFDRFTDLSSYDRKMYKCFLIAAYRTGLRPGELAKLRIKDVEPSKTAWLSVRSNRFGNNKTTSAKRKVPLMPLLTEYEQDLIKEYMHERSLQDSKLVSLFFCRLEDVYQKINLSVLSRATREIFSYLSGGIQYRFYHLRHSALSRLQLVLHGKELDYPPAIAALIPYDEKQCQAILELICGKNRAKVRYYALAAFAGHSDPSVTLTNYLHFSDVIMGLIMQNNTTTLSNKQAQAIYGVSDYQVREHRKTHSVLTPQNVAERVRNKLKTFVKKPVASIDYKQAVQKIAPPANAPSKIADEYDVVIGLLKKIQQDEDYANFAWNYNLSDAQVSQWINSAEALKELKTNRNNSRLFPASRISQLLPAELRDKNEKVDLQQAIKHYRLHYTSSNNNDELRWSIQYALTHCNSSRAGIYFMETQKYTRFMDVATKFFPSTRWRFLLKYTDDEVIKSWQYKAVELTCYRKKQTGRFADGAGWLLLKHKNEAERTKDGLSRYSSHALRIFFHRLAIVLFSEEEIKHW